MSTRVPLGVGDLTVPVPSHLALFYEDDADLRRRLSFLLPALTEPDQTAVLFGPARRIDEVLGYLADEFGRDVEADLRDGRIVRADGAATADLTLANVASALDRAKARGAGPIRLMGFIGWGEPGWPSDAELLQFEATVNKAALGYPAVIVCTYSISRLPGSIIVYGGIETHPYTILGTTLCENPHYVPPDEFIAGRQAAASSTSKFEQLAKVRMGPLDPAPATTRG